MREKLRNLLYFLLAVFAVLAVLRITNWIPSVAQKETMRRYDSLEQVRTALNLRDVYVPAYYPQHISWPPSEIMAQARPEPAVVMAYRERGSGEIVLVITEAVSARFPADTGIRIERLTEKVPYRMKGRSAVLEVGLCGDGGACSRIGWTEEDLRITVAMRSAPFELIRIAESMVR